MADADDAELLRLAQRIAAEAHSGHVDKAGADYIGHPRAVASCVKARGGSAVQQAAAWLHDVVEDTSLTFDDLWEVGIPGEVIGIVDALTKRDGEDYLDAVRRAAAHPGAGLVKRCDVEHNLDAGRLALLDGTEAGRLRIKYTTALQCLDLTGHHA